MLIPFDAGKEGSGHDLDLGTRSFASKHTLILSHSETQDPGHALPDETLHHHRNRQTIRTTKHRSIQAQALSPFDHT